MFLPVPSPAQMPRRRRVELPQRAPVPATFAHADDIPPRGWDRAACWSDAGVLLCAGSDEEVFRLFRSHFGPRLRVPKVIENELRGLTDHPDHDRRWAAERVVRELFVGPGRIAVQEFRDDQLAEVDEIRMQLRKMPNGDRGDHGGEAAVITLATGVAKARGQVQVMLANDGNASEVARQRGLRTRHFADVLHEFTCAGLLTAERAFDLAERANQLSGIPRAARPAGVADFQCRAVAGACTACDHLKAPAAEGLS